jgi:hypothetical protein
MRRYRARQAAGKLVINLELDRKDIETLIEARTLDPRPDFHTREQLAQAVKNFLRLSRYV